MRPYDRAKQIFLAALERPREAREAFVASACGDDEVLRREVMSLLAHADGAEAGGTLPERIGRWRITGRIGEGGMGVVLRGEDDGGQPAALKLLRREIVTPDLVARFSREAEALSRLDHPGIARVLGSGVEPTAQGPQHWLALEYVEGVSLTEWARTSPAEDRRLELVLQLCEAISHAHAQGVVHRDLKPENVIVRPDGRPVLLDFGIARLTDADLQATVALTHTGLLIGTVRYMSPEQADGRADDVGPRSDLYSLAVITYELLAGRPPYDLAGKSVHGALATLLSAEPRPLVEMKGPRRRGIERVLGKALEKAPAARYAGVAEFADDLRRVREGRTPLAPPRRRPLWRRREVRAVAAGLVLVTVAAAAVVIVNEQNSRRDPRGQWPQIDAELTSADARIQLGDRTDRDLLEALRLLGSARARIAALPVQPWSREVERFSWFREGEADLFLARRHMDPARFRQACVAFQTAQTPDRAQPMHVSVPDSSVLWVDQMNELTSLTALATRAGTLEELSKLEGPASVLADSRGKMAEALHRTHTAIGLAGGRQALPADHRLILDLGFRLHGMADARVALAEISGRADELPQALDELREATRILYGQSPAATMAALQNSFGRAYLQRARTGHDAADLDSAESRLRASFGWRVTQRQNLSRHDTARLLAQLAGLRAARARDARTAIAVLGEARGMLLDMLGDVPAGAHPLHRTMLGLSIAELDLQIAETSGDARVLARADSMLGAPAAIPTRVREPVIYAARERLLALADALAAQRFGRTERLTSMREHVKNALYAVPAEEHPVQARELNALATAASAAAR